MRYEVIEVHCDDVLEVLLTTSSLVYANRYLRFLKFKFGDYRDFYIKDNFKDKKFIDLYRGGL